MNKKRILTLAMTALLLFPTGVFAKGHDSNQGKDAKTTVIESTTKAEKEAANQAKKDANQSKKDANKAKKDARKAEVEAFKQSMRQKHEVMNQVRAQIKSVTKEIGPKKDELKVILTDLQSGAKTLPQDQLDKLIVLSDTIKADGDALKALDVIDVEKVTDKAKSGDFDNALASLDGVVAKMQTRLDALNKLSTDLDSILDVAKQATAV